MFGLHRFPQRLGAVAVAVAALLAPLAARAQDIPSYAQPAYVSTDETIHGRIRSVDGTFNITVDDDRGFVDNVQLHQGTIINPTGLTLSPGMSVTIAGTNTGSTFGANEIDTPYSYSGPLPTPVYLGPGYWCPGFAYGYGPSFSLAIVIGGGYGPYSFAHRPFYGRPWNGHGYFGGYVGHAPVGGGRIDATRAISEPTRRVPPAFEGRSFAGESRPANVRYPSANGPGRAAPSYMRAASAGDVHDAPHSFERGAAGGFERGTAGGFERGTAGGGSAAGGSAHGSPGGFSHGGGAGHGGGGASHGGGHAH